MLSVEIVEVGPRDGLQNAPLTLPVAQKVELGRRLEAAGLARIEAVSFVDPRRVPAMAGADEVAAALLGGRARIEALVLNRRGAERAAAAGVVRTRHAVVVSDEFNRRNAGVSTRAGLAEAAALIAEARTRGEFTSGILATAFGCPFMGEVPADDVLAAARQLAAAGCDELIFADTIGVAVPRQVRSMLEAARGLGPRLGVHLHNTRGTGYACLMAAVEAGAEVIDASVGGLGGCPFAPGAAGNIATEDAIWMLEREGVACGAIDLDAVTATAHWLHDDLGLPIDSRQVAAGPFPTPA